MGAKRKKKDKAPKKRSKKDRRAKKKNKGKTSKKRRGKKKNNGLNKKKDKPKKKEKGQSKRKNKSKSSKKGKRNKNKLARRRKNRGKKSKSVKEKKNQKKRLRNKSRKKKLTRQTSCSANQANYQCMEAALKGMMFEQQQITNYLKQSKLLERHQSVSGNKRSKKVIFEEAEQHLLWAIGGDIDNPICGPSDKSSSKYNSTLYEKEKNLAVESYKLLKECDIEIEKSCNISNLER